MSTYTILLQRPAFIAKESGTFFFTTTEGDTPQEAVDNARLQAAHADDVGEINITDYAVLLVIAGAHDDLSHLIDND